MRPRLGQLEHNSDTYLCRSLYLVRCQTQNHCGKDIGKNSHDIQYRQRQRLGIEDLCLTDEQIQNYSLYEIDQTLNRLNRSLKEFQGIPILDMSLLHEIGNRMIMEEQNYDQGSMTQEAINLQRGLNDEQRVVFEKILQAVHRNEGGVFFVYGRGDRKNLLMENFNIKATL
ncbi:Cadherin-related family member 2 [Bienertia sinuspersici]